MVNLHTPGDATQQRRGFIMAKIVASAGLEVSENTLKDRFIGVVKLD
jgi:hypothetical protein